MKKLTPDQYKGIIATVTVHVILILLLMFLALRTPLPLPGEQGVEVNFGYDNQGLGNKQANHAKPKTVKPVEKKNELQKPKAEPAQKQTEAQKKVDENITQNTEDAPALKDKKKETEKKKEEKAEKAVKKKEEKPKPVVNERALFKGTSNKKQGESEGITKGAGDQGKPHGYKESKRYKGTGGEGNGIAFSLGGRGSKYLEKPSVKVTETGTVVVSIWVNPEGKVVRAVVKQKGTDVLDQTQRDIAVKAALNSVFEKDPTAPPEQMGTITYKFILLK